MKHTISVLIYFTDLQGRLLLIERSKAPNQGLWSPIGGKLETALGESPYQAACRETAEEIGLQVEPADLHLFGMFAEQNYEARFHWLLFLFDCRKALTGLPPDIDEGKFGFHAPAALESIPIPETDRTVLWPLYFNHRQAFTALSANCQPGQVLQVRIEERLGGSPEN